MNTKTTMKEPADQLWIDIEWGKTGVWDLYQDLEDALETFGIQITSHDTESDAYEWYVYQGPRVRGGEISEAIQDYWDEFEDMHSDEDDYGLGYPWKRIVTDWKLNGYMVPQFQEAAALFGVQMYILPDESAQERLLLTRHDLSLKEVQRLDRVRCEAMAEKRKQALMALAKEYHVYENVDKYPYQREMRVLQSIWREEQGYPIGVNKYGGKSRPLGSALAMPWAKETLANYLTDTIREVVRVEVMDAKNSAGKLYKSPRIYNNLLSSQPLCFNLFGELQKDLPLATKIFDMLTIQPIQEVTAIEFEYSPGRGDERYTGDRSAFDVYVRYRTGSGSEGFLGIEVKYHENLEDQAAEHRARYDEIAELMGCFDKASYDDLKKQPLQQIWRDHLLAGIHKEVDGFEEGFFVFLYPQRNTACRSAISHYQDLLSAEDSFLSWTVDWVCGMLKIHTDLDWPDLVANRYLNFEKVDQRIK